MGKLNVEDALGDRFFRNPVVCLCSIAVIDVSRPSFCDSRQKPLRQPFFQAFEAPAQFEDN